MTEIDQIVASVDVPSVIDIDSKKNIILDATVFTTMQACARLVDFRFNRQLVPIGGKSVSLEMGSIVHKVMELYYWNRSKGFTNETSIGAGLAAGRLYATGCRDCAEFTATPECPKPLCNHQADEYPGVQTATAEDVEWALTTCEQYFEHYKHDHWIPLYVERVMGKILYEDEEVRILWKAKLDLGVDTNQGIYPVDHKTMKHRRDVVNLNNQFMGQCLVTGTRLMFVNKIGFQKTLKANEKFERATVSYSADRLIEWQSTILPYWAKIMLMYEESGYWPPNWTHCENKYGFCAFMEVCKANRNMREEELRLAFKRGDKWDPSNTD